MKSHEQFAGRAYLSFLFWGICISLSNTASAVIDSVTIGNLVGSDGLAVAGIANPVFLVYALLGVTISVGANILIGRRLGASDKQEANRIFNAQLLVTLALGVALLVGMLLLREPLYRFLGADEALLPLTETYLYPLILGAPLFLLYEVLSLSVSTDGDPGLTGVASGAVILLQLVLEPLLMGPADMGLAGAAVALCLSEAGGILVLLLHFLRKHAILRLRPVWPRWRDFFRFVLNGFGVGSAFVFQALVMLVFNRLLMANAMHGASYVAVFGVFCTVLSLPQELYAAAGNAYAPVVSIFSGEQDAASILRVLRLSLRVMLLLTGILLLLFLPLAGPILRFFGFDAVAAAAMAPLLRVFILSILFSGINTLVTAFWQTVERARLAGVMSVIRNLVAMLSFGLVLIPRYGIRGLAWTYFGAEAVCALLVLAVWLIRPSRRHVQRRYAPTGRVFRRYYVICPASMAAISADLSAVCREWSIPEKQAYFLQFSVEELLLNIAKYGLSDTEHPEKYYLDLRIVEGNGTYTVHIRDNVRLYNPFESTGDEIDNAALRTIRRASHYCDYQRKLIFNYLFLVL